MEMKLDKAKLKQLRESKAWSQSHLADASGVSLRTIQRIEKTGVASLESTKSLCATFAIEIGDLALNDSAQNNATSAFINTSRFIISKADIKATTISFIIAFVIAFSLMR